MAFPGRDLPALDFLRGFEAAARHLSFTRAGAELHLTQSAMSRQVKALEDHFGVALFERRYRQLQLTEAGQTLYRTVRDVLARLRETAATLVATKGGGAITVGTTISFASLWLVPRLAAFQRAAPGSDVRIAASNALVDLDRDGIDVAIRLAPARLAGVGAIHLFGGTVVPVCAPALAAAVPLRKPEDLAHHVLLHYDDPDSRTPWLSWAAWLELARLETLRPAGSLRFSHYEQMIQAAIEGQGVALGREALLDRAFRGGRLIAPLGRRGATALAAGRAYYIVVSRRSGERPEVARFVEWVRAEAALSRAREPDRAAASATRRMRPAERAARKIGTGDG